MARPLSRARGPLKPNQCTACLIRFTPYTVVILTHGDTVICASHDTLVVSEAVRATGTWAEIRRQRSRVVSAPE